MSTITTRAGKGTALSYAEMDANFTNLNNDKLEASALASYETSAHAAATYATQTDLATTNSTVAGKQDALPSQTGNNGKFLGTNGTTLSWNTVDALPSQTGNNGKYLTTNGTTASWIAFTGVSLNGIETLTNKTLTTPVINTNINYSGTSGSIQVGGVDKVTIGPNGIKQGSLETAIRPLGEGQTWQNVTGSRTAGTNYTNSTGRPILVSITSATATSGYGYLTLVIDGITVQNYTFSSGGVNFGACVSSVVPAGSVYSITNSFGSAGGGVSVWAELR